LAPEIRYWQREKGETVKSKEDKGNGFRGRAGVSGSCLRTERRPKRSESKGGSYLKRGRKRCNRAFARKGRSGGPYAIAAEKIRGFGKGPREV